MAFDELEVRASLPSFLSGTVEVPETTLEKLHLWVEEAGLKTNVGVLLDHLKAQRGEPPAEGKPAKKFKIGRLRITGARASLALATPGKDVREVAVPDIELKNIGTAEGGATLAEVTQQVLDAVLREVLKDSSIPEPVRRVLSGEGGVKGAVEGAIEQGRGILEKAGQAAGGEKK
jgi:hypothetical protein